MTLRSMVCLRTRACAPTAVCFVVLATCGWACGGGSSLDEYEEGVPGVVPSPVSRPADAGAGRDGGAGNRDGGAGNRDGGGSAGGAGQGAVGAACDNKADCAGNGASCATTVSLFGLLNYDLEGGYCTVTGCMDDTQCPQGAGCFTLTGNCLKKCTNNNQCRPMDDYQCANLDGTQNLCVPAQAAMDIASIGGLAGGLLGGTGGAGGTGFFGGLLGGGGGTTGGFIGGLFGGGGTPGGSGN
jgi:hypothetical protein